MAQFSPMQSMPSGSRAVSAAPISEPSSMVPVVSTVTCTIIGTSMPAAVIARLAPMHGRLGLQQVLAGLDHHRVDAAVQHAGDLLLRRRRAAPCTARGRGWAAWCRARPSRARTGAGRRVANSSASARASAAPAWASSKIRSAMSYSARLARLAPKVFVSIASTPDLEVGAVHRPDDVRPGHVEDLVAALEAGEVVQRRVLGLQHRAHRAVGHEHALGERGQQRVLGGGWSLPPG